MKHILNFNDFRLNEAFTQSIINKLITKFKLENANLSDNQINYYIDEFDKMKNSSKIIEKDIFKYTFTDLEKLIDSFPKKVNKSEIGLNSADPNDIVYDENNLLILKGDTKEKCIKYGKGYKWCISRQDSSNMFNTYRYRYDEINFYFIFDKDRTDDNRSIVLLVDKNNQYYMANVSNSGDFAGTKEFTFNQICEYQPKIKELKYLFKPLPLTPKEIEIHNKIKNKLSNDNLLEYFGSYEMVEAYISYGHILSDNQYNNLTDDLKNKYINLNHILSDNQLSNSNNKLKERYDNLHSLETWLDSKYTKEEQNNLIELDCDNMRLTNLKGIENLTNLIELNCYDNKLTSLKGIENLTNLTTLICLGNKLINLEGIENLTKLHKLDCSFNKLTSLKGIENLTNLIELCISDSKLTNLEEIHHLTNLVSFVCSDNDYLTSLKGIENLTNLKYLNCNGNKKLKGLEGIENLNNLIYLNCSYNNLTNLKIIENLTNLTNLICSNNNLTNLKGIENLTNLKVLDCSYNKNLTGLEGIENLTKLLDLYCSNNNLRSFKPMQNLTNLRTLDCYYNYVLATPSQVLNIIKNGIDLKNIEH